MPNSLKNDLWRSRDGKRDTWWLPHGPHKRPLRVNSVSKGQGCGLQLCLFRNSWLSVPPEVTGGLLSVCANCLYKTLLPDVSSGNQTQMKRLVGDWAKSLCEDYVPVPSVEMFCVTDISPICRLQISLMLIKLNLPLSTALSFQEQSHLQFWLYCPVGFLLF